MIDTLLALLALVYAALIVIAWRAQWPYARHGWSACAQMIRLLRDMWRDDA